MFGTLQSNVCIESVPDSTAEWVFQHPTEAGAQFTLFLKNGAQVLIGEPKIITIDRTTPFNPAEFIGKGWSIWKGPADGNGLKGEEEQDKRSLALTQLDVTRLQLVTTLEKGETSIVGEEKLTRLKKMADVIRLDAGIFLTFWKNQHLIPLRFKEKTNGNTTYVFCDGTVLRSPHGRRFALYFFWHDGRWHWCFNGLGNGFRVDYPSAVSPQVGPQN